MADVDAVCAVGIWIGLVERCSFVAKDSWELLIIWRYYTCIVILSAWLCYGIFLIGIGYLACYGCI